MSKIKEYKEGFYFIKKNKNIYPLIVYGFYPKLKEEFIFLSSVKNRSKTWKAAKLPSDFKITPVYITKDYKVTFEKKDNCPSSSNCFRFVNFDIPKIREEPYIKT